MCNETSKQVHTDGGTNVEKDVNTGGGDFVGRDQVNYYVSQQIQMSGFSPPPDLEALRQAYLAHLQHAYRALDFKGIPQLDTFARELLLEDVFVPLVARPELPAGDTWERCLAGRRLEQADLPEAARAHLEAKEVEPLRVEQALGQEDRVVVLGDPGSGKTTLLKHLVLRLAVEEGAPLPILVSLNAYAVALGEGDCNLQAYLPRYFAGLAQGVAGLEPLFAEAIRKGQAVILLDGLDEVQSERARLVHKVESFARNVVAQGNKLVVTSRIVGYRESALNAKHWELYTLLDFDRVAIELFAKKWCLAFEKSTLGDTPAALAAAETERQDLLAALEANPGVARLASNPLLLTILALIKRQGVSLPNRRVELYELYLQTLITAWSKARALDRRQIGPELDYIEILMTLGPLALWLRQENPVAGVVSEQALLNWLTRYYMGDDWDLKRGPARQKARGFLESVRRYSNLVLERGQGQYGFMHLTFEEMLAAYGLYQLGQLDLEESLVIIRRHLTDPGWRETILLAVGVWGLANKQPRVAGKVVQAMLAMDCAAEHAGQNLLLAGACLEDVGELGMGRAAAQGVSAALLVAYQDRSLPPTVQRDSGFILGRTGWVPIDLDELVEIPAGPFLYGDDKKEVRIAQPFVIGKYPVTNLQYRRFVAVGGYKNQAYWSAEGWGMRQKDGWEEPRYWRQAKWNNPLAPVVGVSWYEAEAYCQWRTQEMGQTVRLPSEQEWERAARGIDGRVYPWGDEFDHQKLNCAEFWVNANSLDWIKWLRSRNPKDASTNIIGQFLENRSLDGVADMVGNVWEWVFNRDKKSSHVICGGAWNRDKKSNNCSARDWEYTNSGSTNLGFRIVVSPPAP